MTKKIRPKMPPSQRAKQFMPFDAVSGLREALKIKEQEMEELSNDRNDDHEFDSDSDEIK